MEDFSVPRYMFGDSDAGTYLNKVDYLSSCGHKTITVEGHVWDKECFTKNFYINARNPKGIYCASAPANAPVKSTVKTPVKSPIGTTPVKAPVKPPVRTPVKAPVKTPVKAPDRKSVV